MHDSMTRRFIAATAIGLLLSLPGGERVLAQETAGSLAVEDNRLDSVFAERLDFEALIRQDPGASQLVLRFQVGSEGPINRRIPEVEAAEGGWRASHSEGLVRGQIPPASRIRWWWSLEGRQAAELQGPVEERTYLDERFDWQSMESEDLRIWWYDQPPEFAASVRDSARRSLDALEALFGGGFDRRVEIVCYRSQADLRPALVDRGETYEARLATLGARVADDILILDAGTRSQEFEEVLAHELSHIALNLYLEESYIDAPLWLDEGLAMYIEGPLDAEEREVLDRAIVTDELMSVRSMSSFPGDASLVVLAYAQSQDLVSFMIQSRGLVPMRELLTRIGSGEASVDEALESIYGYDQLGLYQAYRESHSLDPAQPVEGATIEDRERRPVSERDRNLPALPPCSASILILLAGLTLQRRFSGAP